MYIALCVAVFFAAYLLNIVTITVGYHRGLAHRAVKLSPWARRGLIACGNWVTGLDPKAWVVMHRLHHDHSDTPQDPHSPVNVGIFGIGGEQLRSYKRVIGGLAKNKEKYTRYAEDLDFPLNRLNTSGFWFVPYLTHAAIAVALGVSVGWLLGVAYFAGMMSHPVQGGMVNALGHAVGSRNFDLPDNSRNNHLAAWLILGEGFQNNHHRYPASPRFSYRAYEIDLGYAACLTMEAIGAVKIERSLLMPRPGDVVTETVPATETAGSAV
jgi:stearoyl-CoA desaturase (delta-9 desaturase)